MIKVFKYGALPPVDGGDIREQMRKARAYYNVLVEAENARRKKIWDATPPVPHEAKTIVDDETGVERSELCKCDECKAHWKVAKERYFSEPPLDVKPFRSKASDAGLYWGSYLSAEESFSAAWKKTKWTSAVRYRSWKQGGVISVQIQRAMLPSSQYKLERADDPRTGRRKGQRHTIKLRIGTGEKRVPLWTDPIKFEMHRPLQGRPTWAKICLKYSGKREVWSVNITCADVPERTDLASDGKVAIDVGWRVMKDGGIRLAMACGSDGEWNELRLGPRWRELTDRADRIRGHRDDQLDVLKIARPEFKQIRKPANVEAKAEADRIMDDVLKVWCKRDLHLAEYERGCRKRSVNARRDAVRVWLRMLRRKYAVAIIKDSSHKKLKEHKRAVEEGINPRVRRNAHHCAPGELIDEICRVFGRNDGVVVVKSVYTSVTCPNCGALGKCHDSGIMKCSACGLREDQDRVSTLNMLRRQNEEECSKPVERKTTARFAKRHKKSEDARSDSVECRAD